MKDYKRILQGVVNIINITKKSDIGFANICAYIGDNCPELKESEDKKIKSDIQYAVRCAYGDNSSKTESVLAWLEKQGKQKPVEPQQDMLSQEKYAEAVDECVYGEQKPVDKVEPKFKVGDIVKHKDNPHLTYILKRFTADGDYEFHAIGKDGNEGCIHFVGVKYQDEWELVEQKWNEDDEKIVTELISIFESAVDGGHVAFPYRLIKDYIRVLKSCLPQPQWKPSEEQMAALQNAIGFVGELTTRGCCLKELKAQLEKLREE